MLNYAKSIGANTDFLTAQAFIFPNGKDQDQLLILILAGIGEDGFAKIRKVGLEVNDLFFVSEEPAAQRFEQIDQFIKESLTDLDRLNGILGFIDKNTLYLQTLGQFDSLLYRQSSILNLTENVESGKLISGLLEDSDKLLFLNPPLTDSEQNNWREALTDNILKTSPDNLEFEVENFLSQLPKVDPIATILIENVQPEEEKTVEEVKKVEIEDLTTSQNEQINNQSYLSPILSSRRSYKNLLTLPSWNWKRLILLLPFLIVGLILIFNLWQRGGRAEANFDDLLTLTRQNLTKADSLKDSEKDMAKQALLEAQKSLSQAQVLKPQDPQVVSLQSRLEQLNFLILKEFTVNDFPLFLDLRLIKDDFNTSRLSHSLGRIALFDQTTKSLLTVKLEQKTPQILAGSLQLGQAQFASINGDNVFVYSKDKGILTVDAGNNKITPSVSADSEWQKVVDIYGFANNVYLLDEFKNQIFKYIATESGFSERNNYLREDVEADFAGGRNLQIDGAVWVLKSDNTILKFVQGGSDFYALQGLETEISRIKNFFVSDETENVYILDNENSRVVLTQKNGQYQSQYKGEKFKTADDLVVDEKNKKLYLLEANKIYLVELK